MISKVWGRDNRLPLYQRLRDEIAQGIARQIWRPGDAIPSEAELAKLHNVALGTMRKALDVLVAEGLLERFQGKGTFVRRANFNASLFRFFRFQSAHGEKRIPESRIMRRQVLVASTAVASALRLPRGSEVIRLVRLRFMDEAPVLLEDVWLPKEKFSALTKLETIAFGNLLYPMYEKHCGQTIASAEETLTVELVRATDAKVLRIPIGAPVIVIERIAFDFARTPIEWRRSRGPADQYRYHVEIR
jgi:GntR family transcriptional regulator